MVEGFCDERFKGLRDVFVSQLDAGDDLGASLALSIDGEVLVDLWGGWRDEAQTSPWAADTVVNVWSTTKTMTNLCALMLVDRGQLDVHEKVATYWPEFAANGKDAIEVRHVLGHTSGVSGWDPPVEMADLYDWDKSTSMLAGQAPWWEPGTACGYHAMNQGHLVGELIRRIDGRHLKQFFAEEVAGPLDADFQIGLAPADTGRVTNVIPPPPIDLQMDLEHLDMESPAIRTMMGPIPDANAANTAAWRAADMGAINGHGNARSVLRIQQAISNGGQVDGVRLLSPDTIDLIFDEQARNVDLVLGVPLCFGIGYGLVEPETEPYVPDDPGICFWGGWGGSLIVNDVARRMSVSYMMNKMGAGIIGSERSAALLTATYEALA
jgi:CubicO group peptidase (beta-lactamase class C family)